MQGTTGLDGKHRPLALGVVLGQAQRKSSIRHAGNETKEIRKVVRYSKQRFEGWKICSVLHASERKSALGISLTDQKEK